MKPTIHTKRTIIKDTKEGIKITEKSSSKVEYPFKSKTVSPFTTDLTKI